MTEISMSVREYLRKAGIDLDGDFLAQAAALVAQATMELEVTQQIGAAKHERTPARQTQRNGYRERNWATRVGDIPLRIPKLRQGSYFPSLLEPRRRAEQALLAVVQQAYIEGVSTRKLDDLLQALGLTGIDKSQVSRICKELTEVVEAFRNRPLVGRYPYVWLDALYVKVRVNHRIVSQAVVLAIGVQETGEREVLGFAIGASEDRDFWLSFLRHLVERGLQGVQLVISDSHAGLQAALSQVLTGATWQRCRVHTIRTQFHFGWTFTREGHVTVQRDHVANLQGVLAHYNALDQQLQERLLFGKGKMVEAILDVRTEGGQTLQHLLGAVLLLMQLRLLPLLVEEALPPERQFLTTLAQFVEADDLGLIRIHQSVFLAL